MTPMRERIARAIEQTRALHALKAADAMLAAIEATRETKG
jgi:hypothetical protein